MEAVSDPKNNPHKGLILDPEGLLKELKKAGLTVKDLTKGAIRRAYELRTEWMRQRGTVTVYGTSNYTPREPGEPGRQVQTLPPPPVAPSETPIPPKPEKPPTKPQRAPETNAKGTLYGHKVTHVMQSLGRLGWKVAEVEATILTLGYAVTHKAVDSAVYVGKKVLTRPVPTLTKEQVRELTVARDKGAK